MFRKFVYLMALAHEARKPVFHRRAADGALGSHSTAAKEAGRDFKRLARAVARGIGFDIAAAAQAHG